MNDQRNDTGEMTFAGDRLPKLCGADVQLGNFVLGVDRPGGTGSVASHALLREIAGLPQKAFPSTGCHCPVCRAHRESETENSSWRAWSDSPQKITFSLDSPISSYSNGSYTLPVYNPQDWGRKFLPANGGCVYIDLDHLELCLPEVQSAYDHLASWQAMLRIARQALEAANTRMSMCQFSGCGASLPRHFPPGYRSNFPRCCDSPGQPHDPTSRQEQKAYCLPTHGSTGISPLGSEGHRLQLDRESHTALPRLKYRLIKPVAHLQIDGQFAGRPFGKRPSHLRAKARQVHLFP